MACKDPSVYRSSIAKCNFNAYGGVSKCPEYMAATKANGAKCLALPIFDNGPPFGDFACKGATGEMATMCKAAGFPVAGASAATGTGTGETKSTVAKVGDAIASVPGAIADGYTGMSTAGQIAVPTALGVTAVGAIGEAYYRKKRDSTVLGVDPLGGGGGGDVQAADGDGQDVSDEADVVREPQHKTIYETRPAFARRKVSELWG